MVAIDLATVTLTVTSHRRKSTRQCTATARSPSTMPDALGTESARGIEQTTLDGVLHWRRRLLTKSSERRSAMTADVDEIGDRVEHLRRDLS
jgi:hypothetical protein